MMDILELKNQARHSVPQICMELLPEGKAEGGCWKVGSVSGEKGRSLSVFLNGDNAGKWTDFATGEHGDVIDLVQLSQRLNLNDAMEWVKRHCGVKDVTQTLRPVKRDDQPGKAYLPPQDPTSPNLHAYLESRGFENLGEIVLKWKIYETQERGGAIVFPAYDVDGSLTYCKGITHKAEKKEIQAYKTGSNPTQTILYGWHTLPENTRKVWITEGEYDAIALSELGFAALSLPNGVQSVTKALANDFHKLDRFEEIAIATDMDEPGRKAAQAIKKKLGDRAIVVSWEGGKDANEILKTFGYEQAKIIFEKAFDDSKWKDPSELRTVFDFVEDVDSLFEGTGLARGWRSGWQKLDDKDIRFKGLWGLAGINGHGKSMWLGQLVLNLITQGAKPVIASPEMTPDLLLKRLIHQAAGSPKPPKPYRDAILSWMGDKMHLYVNPDESNPDSLMKVFDYAHRRYGSDVFVIDSLTNFAGTDNHDRAYQEQRKFIDALVKFKYKNDVTVFLVTHVRKGEDESRAPNKMDIKGSGSISDLADGFLSVWRNKRKREHLDECEKRGEEPNEKFTRQWDFYLEVLKNRNGMFEGKIGFEIDQACHQYQEKKGSAPRYYIKYSKERNE